LRRHGGIFRAKEALDLSGIGVNLFLLWDHNREFLHGRLLVILLKPPEVRIYLRSK
jgi:hypothetical protein